MAVDYATLKKGRIYAPETKIIFFKTSVPSADI